MIVLVTFILPVVGGSMGNRAEACCFPVTNDKVSFPPGVRPRSPFPSSVFERQKGMSSHTLHSQPPTQPEHFVSQLMPMSKRHFRGVKPKVRKKIQVSKQKTKVVLCRFWGVSPPIPSRSIMIAFFDPSWQRSTTNENAGSFFSP